MDGVRFCQTLFSLAKIDLKSNETQRAVKTSFKSYHDTIRAGFLQCLLSQTNQILFGKEENNISGG